MLIDVALFVLATSIFAGSVTYVGRYLRLTEKQLLGMVIVISVAQIIGELIRKLH